MSLDKSLKNLKYDKRMTDHNLNTGQLTQKELDQHIKSLPDSSANVDIIRFDDEAVDEAPPQQH